MNRRYIAACIFVALHIMGVVALSALNRIPPTGMGWFMTGFGATMAIHVSPADIVTFDGHGLPIQPLSMPRAEVVLTTGRYLQQILVPLPTWPLLTASLLCIAAAIVMLWMGKRRV